MYLIIKCDELFDQDECDYNRMPICLTEDCSQYGVGYEIYKVNPNGTFSLIKDTDMAKETGMCVVVYNDDDDIEKIEKFPNKKGFSKKEITVLKTKYHLVDTVNEIFNELSHSIEYDCAVNDKCIILGKYRDNHYPRP